MPHKTYWHVTRGWGVASGEINLLQQQQIKQPLTDQDWHCSWKLWFGGQLFWTDDKFKMMINLTFCRQNKRHLPTQFYSNRNYQVTYACQQVHELWKKCVILPSVNENFLSEAFAVLSVVSRCWSIDQASQHGIFFFFLFLSQNTSPFSTHDKMRQKFWWQN